MNEPIKQVTDRRLCTCIHFNGIQNKTCKAGLSYSRPLPCLAPFSPNISQPACPKFEPHTLEQIKKEDEEFELRSAQIHVARAAIVKATKGKWGVGGTMLCPVCETGHLRYTVAGCNGHIHAGCTFPDCVGWME